MIRIKREFFEELAERHLSALQPYRFHRATHLETTVFYQTVFAGKRVAVSFDCDIPDPHLPGEVVRMKEGELCVVYTTCGYSESLRVYLSKHLKGSSKTLDVLAIAVRKNLRKTFRGSFRVG